MTYSQSYDSREQAMADVDGLAGPGAGKIARQAPESIGSVADFIEIVKETAGKHFKCCICFRSVGSFASHTPDTHLPHHLCFER